jgi:MYXO-CTERM domain-containing protein
MKPTRLLFSSLRTLPVLCAITGMAQAATVVPLTVTNPGFASGSTGWVLSNFTVTSGYIQAGSQISPNAGLANPDATAVQTIDLTPFATDIDASNATATLNYSVWRQDSYDEHSASLLFFDALNVSLGGATPTLAFGSTGGGFVAGSIDGVAVPIGARSMRITLIADIGTAGGAIGVAFDNVGSSLSVVPEPAAALLGSLGALLLLRRRRN